MEGEGAPEGANARVASKSGIAEVSWRHERTDSIPVGLPHVYNVLKQLCADDHGRVGLRIGERGQEEALRVSAFARSKNSAFENSTAGKTLLFVASLF